MASEAVHMSASEAAQTRVLADEDPALQASVEQLAVLYSIRKILIIALFILPAVVAALVIIGVLILAQ